MAPFQRRGLLPPTAHPLADPPKAVWLRKQTFGLLAFDHEVPSPRRPRLPHPREVFQKLLLDAQNDLVATTG